MNSPKTSRLTRQRQLILDELRRTIDHPSADMIYERVRQQIPRISLGTVYRNLDLLTDQGKIIKLESAGGHMRFDGNTAPHSHVVCRDCGHISDIHRELTLTTPVSSFSVPGFTIEGHTIVFFGICDSCRGKNDRCVNQ